MNHSLIRNGFIAAGLANILGVLLFTKLFTSSVIPETDPVVMSTFGLILIMVWGLAFMATANGYARMKWIVGVFALEKLAYVVAWLLWMSSHSLGPVYDRDVFAGVFYAIYGINDLIFLVFFLAVFWKLNQRKIPVE